jgi:hypothetical protein
MTLKLKPEHCCAWRGCDLPATRRLGFGHVTPRSLLHARYCDGHARHVHALFFVERDEPVRAPAPTAA